MSVRGIINKARHFAKYRGRGPVALLNREAKGRMIRAIVEDFAGRPASGLTILDIGCGNGGISNHFSKQGNEVFGVDVDDKRKGQDLGFEFRLVESERLPFENQRFDLVISHHVIEHVPDQALHLAEIRRVLKPTGLCYLATPNKTSPFMEGHIGNEWVLRHAQMQPLFERCGFDVKEYSFDVLSRPDEFFAEKRYGRFIPKRAAEALRPWYPSHLFMLRPL
ncbi:MAG: hypothetical protein RJA70_785 [Pseudomonadota bacterium]|jgi:2-polyprenyl-3-methyl-5-hydroxy-6-metoxy-1,4-benzoquinol methylase